MNTIVQSRKDEILEKMEVCNGMVFNTISNSANILLHTAYAHCTGVDEGYVKYRKWYYEKACDILAHPEKYDGVHCTEIVETFDVEMRKKAKALHKLHHNDYLTLA